MLASPVDRRRRPPAAPTCAPRPPRMATVSLAALGAGRRAARRGGRPRRSSSSPRSASFSDDDLELARHLADATRGALERSELFEAERSARALAQQLTRTGRLLTTELDPAAVLDEVVQQAPALVQRGRRARSACSRATSSSSARPTATAPTPRSARAARPAAGSRATSSSRGAPVALENAGADPRLRELDPMLAAGNAAYLGVPLAGAGGCAARRARRLRAQPRAVARGGDRGAARARGEHVGRALERRAVPARRARAGAVASRSSPTSPTASSPSTAKARSSSGTRAAEKITGVPATDALGRAPVEVLQRTLESRSDTPPGDRLVPIMRGREEVWLSVTEAVMRDPLGAVAGRIFAFRDISADRLVEQMKSDFVSHGLARAAHAAHVDLRLRRDAAAPGRPVRRGGARRRSSATSRPSRSG